MWFLHPKDHTCASALQSLDDGRPQKTLQKPPLRQETNIANFSYRFSMYNINGEITAMIGIIDLHPPACPGFSFPFFMFSSEALNQGDPVDLDALMADLCSIEQELSTISKPNSTSRSQSKGQQRTPGGRSASMKHAGTSGGGSSGGSPSK